MKKRALITGLPLLCAGLLFFASCSNLLDSQKEAASAQSGENGKVTFNGSICVTGVQPAAFSHADKSRNDSSVSRSALPSFSVTGSYYYYAEASQTDGSGLRSINSINNPDAFDTTDGVTFSMDLSVGTWKIECGIHHEASPTPLLIDTYQSSLSAETLVLNHTFYPKPVQSGKENGLVDLSMTIPPSVKFVSSICSNTDWKVDVVVDGPANAVTIKTKDMNNHNYTKSGSYEVTFNFYDENAILLYSSVQIINVFDYLTTNTWVSDGSSLIDESGNFILSNDLIAQFKRTTFYVGQTAAATSAGKTASNDTGKGSAYEPLATIRKAASIIAATGDGSKDYRIFVSGTLEGAQEIPDTLTTGSAKSVTIQGYDGLDSSGEPKDAIHITSQGAALYVTSGVPVTLRNLKILGSQNPAIETIGLGLEANKNVDVTISDGVLITGHQTAGVYIGEGAKLSMTGGKISENHASKGAGVTNGGIFIMTGGEISSNTASEKGGAVANSGTFNISGFAYIPYGADGSTGTGKNDIYLASGKTVTLGGTLKVHNADNPIAITPHTWKRRTTVVQAVNSFSESYKNYFTYTQDGWNSKFSDDKKSIAIDAPIYVAGTGRAVCTADGSNTPSANGLKGAPFATIAKAIEVMDDNTADYTIYIDGTVTGTQEIPNTLTNTNSGTYKAQSLIIVGVNGLDENGVPRDELNGNQSGTTLKVDSNVSVSITNLKITGGNGSNGGGLSVSSSSTVKLLDGTLITGNEATLGGGVYNQGSLYMAESAMIGKSTDSIATSLSYGNKATLKGAGICSLAGAKLYLGYTSWISDSDKTPAELTGGVCENYLANTDNASAQGGGIYNKGSIYFASGNVSYNYALNGAGIYTEESVTMTGGTIEGNEGNASNSAGSGGGVYVTGGSTFSMSGNAQIKNNKNMALGAGVYLNYNNSRLIMADGTISGNIAETNGGAVYMHDMSTTSRSLLEIAGEANIPYGGEAKNNDIFMLDTNVRVTIKQSLSARDAGNVIGITPNSYTEGRPLLAAEDGVTLANEVGKFKVTQDPSGTTLGTGLERGLDSEGKYSKSLIYVDIGENDVNDVRDAINSLISNSTEPVKLCLTEDFQPQPANASDSNYSNKCVIRVSSEQNVTITASTSVTIKANVVLNPDIPLVNNNCSNVFIVDGGSLTLGENVTIDGRQSERFSQCNGVYVKNGGSLTLDGAKITNVKYDGGGGAVYVYDSGTVTIKGNTEIYNNSVTGLYIEKENSKVYMEGGSIHDNTDNGGASRGGGVLIRNGGKLIKTGGRIYNNKVYGSRNSQVYFYTGGGYYGFSESNLTQYANDTRWSTESDIP